MDNNKIISGSRAFFSEIPEFQPRDNDYVVFVDYDDSPNGFVIFVKIDKQSHAFNLPRMPKEEYIKRANANLVHLCNFLVPEIAEQMGISVEDLPKIKYARDNFLDDIHEYLGIIYDSYIENNEFRLTDEQRKNAFKNYKESRERVPKTHKSHKKKKN